MNKLLSTFLAATLFASTIVPYSVSATTLGTVEVEIVEPQENLNTETVVPEVPKVPVTEVEVPGGVVPEQPVTNETQPTKPAEEPTEVDSKQPVVEEGKDAEAEQAEAEKPETPELTVEKPTAPLHGEQITAKQKLADIPNGFWAKNEVMQLVEMSVINGYPDGEFRPSLAINRGQAANLFSGALQLPDATYQAKFSDVSSKSGFIQGVFSTYTAGIFGGKPDGRFGVSDALTREQMATTLVRAFNLKDTGEQLTFKDWNKISESHRENVEILAQHGITTGREDGTFDPKATVNRATFSVMLHRALVATSKIAANTYTIQAADASSKFTLNRKQTNFVQVTNDSSPLYLRSAASIALKSKKTESFGVANDTIYTYAVGSQGATMQVTVRELTNGDEFVFSTLNNPSKSKVTVELFQKATNITNYRLYRYDRFPISKNSNDVFGHDSSSYPTGLLRTMTDGKLTGDRMVGQAYRSQQLTQKYANGGVSTMRDLKSEYEALSTIWLGSDFLSFYTLTSNGNDIVDTWYMDSTERLFTTDENMNDWMLETALNYKKRNNWYTAEGPYNKMATTTEPMPKSYQGFGRNLLLVKEDRALVLFKEQGDRYFANLVKNSFISLEQFKGSDKYWETEVTSTYLKGLYNINAPFIDTRFNEQIALFYYNSGAAFSIPNYKEPLRNYADLLVSREAAGHVIPVAKGAYYISDYFPINQDVTTHSSMNHILGGMNILLMAYNEFGDPKYIKTATAIQKAIAIEKNKWIRGNGDIWYRVNKQGQFAGEDYQHLTLEDLINAYRLWKDIDATYLPIIEEMIASKAGYLSINQYGYTTKIKNGLQELDMMKYLPLGTEHTDAL